MSGSRQWPQSPLGTSNEKGGGVEISQGPLPRNKWPIRGK